MRKTRLAKGEYYHIYNRGVEKRDIFQDEDDVRRFLQGMAEFNVVDPIGSLYANQFRKGNRSGSAAPVHHPPLSNRVTKRAAKKGSRQKKNDTPLVRFIAYCLNPNHYHFILQPVEERGIERFMHRLGSGYTRHFNEKYERTGVLFQGAYKAAHIDSNEKLLRLSAYVNLNFDVHQLSNSVTKLVRSSWEQYHHPKKENVDIIRCDPSVVLEQFHSRAAYRRFACEALADIVKQRQEQKKTALPLIE